MCLRVYLCVGFVCVICVCMTGRKILFSCFGLTHSEQDKTHIHTHTYIYTLSEDTSKPSPSTRPNAFPLAVKAPTKNHLAPVPKLRPGSRAYLPLWSIDTTTTNKHTYIYKQKNPPTPKLKICVWCLTGIAH